MRAARTTLPLFIATIALGCGSSDPAGRFRAKIVVDRAVMAHVKVFQVFALEGTIASGTSALTCDDIPSRYRVGDPQLLPATIGDDPNTARAQMPWDGSTTEARLKLTVPADEEIVLVVKALGAGSHVVARGCADNLQFSDGEEREEKIDAQATTGGPCSQATDCEVDQSCHLDSLFLGGYCAKLGCNADQDCPPGSRCLIDATTGGICARVCISITDCGGMTPGGYDCVGRSGPGGCAETCIPPTWNVADKCP